MTLGKTIAARAGGDRHDGDMAGIVAGDAGQAPPGIRFDGRGLPSVAASACALCRNLSSRTGLAG